MFSSKHYAIAIMARPATPIDPTADRISIVRERSIVGHRQLSYTLSRHAYAERLQRSMSRRPAAPTRVIDHEGEHWVNTFAASELMRSAGYGTRLRIGMMLPCRNTVSEPEFNSMLPKGVSLHTTRLRLLGTSRAELTAMTDDVEQAAELLAAAQVDMIVFHCTAVSTLDADMGDKLVARIQRSTRLPAVATSLALLSALATLKSRRIVMVTPYRQAINDDEVAFFAHHGVEVLQNLGLGLPDAKSMASVTPEDWYRHTVNFRRPDAEAYFLSCTNIQAVAAIAALESALSVPVISSNQAMLWHALRASGIEDRLHGYGRLLQDY
jgi:maleate isomerase